MSEDEIMSEDERFEDFRTHMGFKYQKGKETVPVIVPGEDRESIDREKAFKRIRQEYEIVQQPGNRQFVVDLKKALQQRQEEFIAKAASLASLALADWARRAAQKGTTKEQEPPQEGTTKEQKDFEESLLLTLQDGEFVLTDVAEDRLSEITEGSLPSPVRDVTEHYVRSEDFDVWAEWVASHIFYWARQDLLQELREGGTDPESLSNDEANRRFESRVTSDELEYGKRAARNLRVEVAGIIARKFLRNAKGNPSVSQIEHLLELYVPEPDLPRSPDMGKDGFFPWASGPPASEGATAIRQAREGWPAQDSEDRPEYPFDWRYPYHVEGKFRIVESGDAQVPQAAGAESARRVLGKFNQYTIRLHLACATYCLKDDPGRPVAISRPRVYEMLGLDWNQRPDLSRDQRDEIVEEAFLGLRRLGIEIEELDGPDGGPSELGLEPVWDLDRVRWGRKRVPDSGRILDTEDWVLLAQPNAWQQLYLNEETGVRQFHYFSRELIEDIDWHKSREGGDLAIELLKSVRFQYEGAPRDVTVGTLLQKCQLDGAKDSYKRTRHRGKLVRAIRAQKEWGWEIEWTGWPEKYRPNKDRPNKERQPDYPDGWWNGKKRDDWERPFHEWEVTFHPPERLAKLNSQAQEAQDLGQIDRRDEASLGSWDERIKAIMRETGFTQSDLAKHLGVHRAAVNQWINGKRTPSGPHKRKLQGMELQYDLRKWLEDSD